MTMDLKLPFAYPNQQSENLQPNTASSRPNLEIQATRSFLELTNSALDNLPHFHSQSQSNSDNFLSHLTQNLQRDVMSRPPRVANEHKSQRRIKTNDRADQVVAFRSSQTQSDKLTPLSPFGIHSVVAPSIESITHFHMQYQISPESRTTLLLQFQLLKEEANAEVIHVNRGLALPKQTIELFNNLCNTLHLGHTIKVKAMDIYDRFMVAYSDFLSPDIAKFSKEGKLDEISNRLDKQAILRICSCIHLAYKFHYDSNDGNVNLYRIQKLLRRFSLEFSTKAIIRSEARVFKLIDFRIHFVTCLDILEHMIILLCDKNVNGIPELYHVSVRLLEFTYLYHADIYRRVKNQKITFGHGIPFKTMEFNIVFRSAAILTAAIFFIQPDFQQQLGKIIADLCSIPEQAVLNFSVIIIDEVLPK